MTIHRPVHPFPARMAPELASARVATLDRTAVVLDPMMGSGTFPLTAALNGHRAVGVDSDPLAVLISQASANVVDAAELVASAEDVIYRATLDRRRRPDGDDETRRFIDYWFDQHAQGELAALAWRISQADPQYRPVLWCAFSRLIVTKDAGVSLARDVSHSRPHRARELASFSPLDRFMYAVQTVIARRVAAVQPRDFDPATLILTRGDARKLPLPNNTVDAVMTSPPYLNAIDYLRGHRLALVWMGYSVATIRSLRAANIGTEVGADADSRTAEVVARATQPGLSARSRRIVNNYVADLDSMMQEIVRVLKVGGSVSFVIADAKIAGSAVSIGTIMETLAGLHGLAFDSRQTRALPSDRRYLPPPADASSSLVNRMRMEIVLSFNKR